MYIYIYIVLAKSSLHENIGSDWSHKFIYIHIYSCIYKAEEAVLLQFSISLVNAIQERNLDEKCM